MDKTQNVFEDEECKAKLINYLKIMHVFAHNTLNIQIAKDSGAIGILVEILKKLKQFQTMIFEKDNTFLTG